jgi:hypothetical protein
MSSVIAVPELITTAATDLANIGSTLSGAHTAAAASTVTVLPAAEDEVGGDCGPVFPSTTHYRPRVSASSSVAMLGNATLTIVTSRLMARTAT